jgi:TonB family protein
MGEYPPTNGSAPKSENGARSQPVVEPPTFSSGDRAISRQSTVRILDTSGEGSPWGKIAAFGVAALLICGVLFLFWGPYSGLAKQPSTAEAKTVTRSGRVIQPGESSDDRIQIPGSSSVGVPPDMIGADPVQKLFDPKSLIVPKLATTEPLGQIARLTPPALRGNAIAADLSGLPFLPQPPPYAPPVVEKTPPPAPAIAPPQTTEAPPAPAVRIGGSYTQPVLIHKVDPVYPLIPAGRKPQGAVSFQATIDKDGAVKNLKLLSGDPLLDLAAQTAVLQWKFRPARLNGEPLEVTQTIVVKFNPNR